MKKSGFLCYALILLLFFWPLFLKAQPPDSVWTLQMCLQQALKENIQVQKSSLSNEINRVNTLQAKAERLPSADASVSENIGWSKPLGTDNRFGTMSSANNMNYGVSSSVTLYNGFRINNSIRQSEILYESGKYSTEAMKEEISLSVLDAYLQVLYAEELVKNSRDQMQATAEQVQLAEQRLLLGSISKSDLLQVRSQLASEKLTLINAQNQLRLSELTLMQLMELPYSNNFTVAPINYENILLRNSVPGADSVYQQALSIKPEIESARLDVQSAGLDVSIARAAWQPSLSLHAGLNTGYSSELEGLAYDYQVQNKINPSVGLTLSVPIYENRQIRSKVEIAKIGIQNAELDEKNTKNQLRKNVEQACTDVSSAEEEYNASTEQYDAAFESYQLATEKFNQGLLNSVDYLFEKTNLIVAESKLLQSKYNLIFSYKKLDFYMGLPIEQ
jgi:outer membrane protein